MDHSNKRKFDETNDSYDYNNTSHSDCDSIKRGKLCNGENKQAEEEANASSSSAGTEKLPTRSQLGVPKCFWDDELQELQQRKNIALKAVKHVDGADDDMKSYTLKETYDRVDEIETTIINKLIILKNELLQKYSEEELRTMYYKEVPTCAPNKKKSAKQWAKEKRARKALERQQREVNLNPPFVRGGPGQPLCHGLNDLRRDISESRFSNQSIHKTWPHWSHNKEAHSQCAGPSRQYGEMPPRSYPDRPYHSWPGSGYNERNKNYANQRNPQCKVPGEDYGGERNFPHHPGLTGRMEAPLFTGPYNPLPSNLNGPGGTDMTGLSKFPGHINPLSYNPDRPCMTGQMGPAHFSGHSKSLGSMPPSKFADQGQGWADERRYRYH